jgi:hypothetical protein
MMQCFNSDYTQSHPESTFVSSRASSSASLFGINTHKQQQQFGPQNDSTPQLDIDLFLPFIWCILLIFEAILFGLFTCIMACSQIWSIIQDESQIEHWQKRRRRMAQQRMRHVQLQSESVKVPIAQPQFIGQSSLQHQSTTVVPLAELHPKSKVQNSNDSSHLYKSKLVNAMHGSYDQSQIDNGNSSNSNATDIEMQAIPQQPNGIASAPSVIDLAPPVATPVLTNFRLIFLGAKHAHSRRQSLIQNLFDIVRSFLPLPLQHGSAYASTCGYVQESGIQRLAKKWRPPQQHMPQQQTQAEMQRAYELHRQQAYAAQQQQLNQQLMQQHSQTISNNNNDAQWAQHQQQVHQLQQQQQQQQQEARQVHQTNANSVAYKGAQLRANV